MAEAQDRKRPIPWVASVRLDEVPEGGKTIELAPDEPTRAALAAYAGVRTLPRASATFEVRRHGRSNLHVTGEVRATVGQTCVVSLEPMESEVVEPVDVVFKPATDAVPADERAETAAAESEGDPPEPLVDGTADLGALATQFLILGIDPYPRKPDAVFEAPATKGDDAGPFAALARLKGSPDNKK